MAKITKAQYGGSTPIPRGTKSLPKPKTKTNPKFEMDMEKKKNLESFLKMGRGSKLQKGGKIKKACKGTLYPKSSSVSSRLKKGGSFPDLNKDGKITKADILKGRGVIAKKGMKVKKAQDGLKTVNPGYGASSAGLQITKKAQKRKADESKSKYEASPNPKVEYKTRLMKTPEGTFGGSKFSVDTTGLAAGKRRFPVKRTTRSGKDVYYETNRPGAKRSVRASQMKKGGMVKTKKCAYGCK
jgi:hypothetical protein